MSIEHIILGAGGVRGIAILGAFDELVKNRQIDPLKIKSYAGVSVGSILALLLSIHVPSKDIYEFFHDPPNPVPNILLLFVQFGIETGTGLITYLQQILESRGLESNITFEKHHDHFGKELYIQSTNLNLMKGEIYSYKTHPNMSVIEAIRRSIAVPLYFVPPKDDNGHHHVDGAIVGHSSLESLFPEDKTLSIMIRTRPWERNHPFANFQEFVQHLMLMLWIQGQPDEPSSPNKIIIDTDDWGDSDQQPYGKNEPAVLEHMITLGRSSIRSHHLQVEGPPLETDQK